jgi:GNAT superfamily N-acetyltransferase
MDRRIRTATAPDLPLLLALYGHLNDEGPPPPEAAARNWRALLANPAITLFLAEAAGEAVATCMLIVTPSLTRAARPFALIENVVTHAAHRRQGHGRAVLRAALDAAWAQDCYKAMLLTGSRQESTMRFYEGAGFRRGEKTGFVARPL